MEYSLCSNFLKKQKKNNKECFKSYSIKLIFMAAQVEENVLDVIRKESQKPDQFSWWM